MSAYLTKWITIWAEVTLIWPAGRYIDQKSSKNYFFISVWSGLGPNYSLLQAAHQNTLTTNGSSWRIVNLFGERHYAHILPDVEQLFVTTQSDTTKHLLYLSQETQLPPMYHQGRIQLGIDEALEFLWEDFAAYICGTPAMVNDIKQELLQRNVSPSRIIVEKY
jgi:NAD(P)H-flavin reductase